MRFEITFGCEDEEVGKELAEAFLKFMERVVDGPEIGVREVFGSPGPVPPPSPDFDHPESVRYLGSDWWELSSFERLKSGDQYVTTSFDESDPESWLEISTTYIGRMVGDTPYKMVRRHKRNLRS